MVAHFCRAYGADAYWRGWGRTRDGAIPWGVFTILASNLPAVWAMDVMNTAEGHARAEAAALGSKSKASADIKALLDRALPET